MRFGMYIFSRLISGTVITVTMDSGNYIGPAIFISYHPISGTVTLREQGGISPPTTTITKIDANKVESITFNTCE